MTPYLYGIAWCCVFTSLLTIRSVPTLWTNRWQSMIQIMVQKLAPLHHHVCDLCIWRDPFGRNHFGGDQTCARFLEAIVQSFPVPSDRCAQSVLVKWPQQTPESSVWCAPMCVHQIIACAINRTVFQVEAHVLSAVWLQSMRITSRQLFNQFQVLGRQNVIVAEIFGFGHQRSARINSLTKRYQCSLINLGSASKLTSISIRITNHFEQIAMMLWPLWIRAEQIGYRLINSCVHFTRSIGESDANSLVRCGIFSSSNSTIIWYICKHLTECCGQFSGESVWSKDLYLLDRYQCRCARSAEFIASCTLVAASIGQCNFLDCQTTTACNTMASCFHYTWAVLLP